MAFEALFPAFRSERILHDQGGLLLVDKPPGIVVHGGDEQQASDLVSRLKRLLRGRGEGDYLGVHQRLDLGTSGVLAFTRDPALNASVAEQMEAHSVARAYVAVVSLSGKARLRDSGVIDERLETAKGRTRVVKSGGQRALTRYRVLASVRERALLELRPETGRTHQLRVHLSHVGAPIVGDSVYGSTPAERLFLHARDLVLQKPALSAHAPVPAAFDAALHARAPELGSADNVRGALADAGCLREPLLATTDTFRIVNDLGDFLPGVCVDRYGDFAVLALSSDEAAERRQELAALLHEFGARGVYLKQRARADLRRETHAELAPKEPIAGEPVAAPLIVREGEARFAVTLDEGLSCGLFLDQRDNRARVAAFCGGRKVLNLFSYTCSFSVYAALASAEHVTSVDLSGHALARGRENFRLNGLDPAAHAFVQTDALEWLARAAKRGEKFGVVILDPPSFSTSGKGKTFRVADGYQGALERVFAVLEPDGRVLAVTNHRKTSPQAFRKIAHDAARAAGREISQLKDLPSPLDCPPGPSGPFPAKSVLISVQ
ncbi:MAG TPA: class I SAM-dependent methyltransferase [Polyangiaceae bacterium]|nr:class I SAM-dependent methyltransferase [Polyangiaceae bacterium]